MRQATLIVATLPYVLPLVPEQAKTQRTSGSGVPSTFAIPRSCLLSAIEIGEPVSRVVEMVQRHGFSRIPVYRGELDHVEGVVYAKDVLRVLAQGQKDTPLAQVIRPAHFI